MATETTNVKTIFGEALEIESPTERSAYLDRACGDRADLRAEIEELLEAHDKAGSFMTGPALEPQATMPYVPVAEAPGTVIGPYKLLQQIGEGGFGVVFMAEQREPVKRKVALKIIKPGMDTKQVVARFEAERQALALMDHPNVARVLDAGATDSGRPYFVMELVRGVPITDYCDKNDLSTEDRLKLFATVCRAVQHAHQKGIIHRDIKPSNIMVTLHDGKPVPKIIDFGVAKAISQPLTEKTLFTAYGQIIGTIQYMSPEQAEMSGLDVDTRSDVYSLGVLLYELLTGTTPLEAETLRKAGYAEIQRIIREQEPPRPSVRLSTIGEQATVVAKHRSTNPKRLRQMIRGELDWIVMKTLDKERNRRYESPTSLATDIERFLNHEAVEACPPSTSYRLRKFVRRHKGPVAAAMAVAITLVAGIVGTSVGLAQVVKERDRNRELVRKLEAQTETLETQKQAIQSQRDEVAGLFKETILAAAMGGQRDRTEFLLKEADRVGVSESWREMVQGILALFSGSGEDIAAAIEHLERAIELDDGDIAARALLVRARLVAGLDWYQQALDLKTCKPKTAEEYLFLAFTTMLVDRAEGLRYIKKAVELRNLPLARAVRADLLTHYVLDTGKQEFVKQAFEDVQAARAFMPESPFVLRIDLNVHQAAIRAVADEDRRDQLRREADEILEQLDRHPSCVLDHAAKATHFMWLGLDEEARGELEKAFEADEPMHGEKWWIVPFLYETGDETDHERALALVDTDNEFDRISHAILQAEIPGGRQLAIDTLQGDLTSP